MRKLLSLLLVLVSSLLCCTPKVFADDWTQEAHDAQRTGYTSEDPTLPWSYAWSWNGSDANGKTTGNLYDAPVHDAYQITGGGFLFVPAGTNGLYALNLQTGKQVWRYTGGDVHSTPAYDSATGIIYVPTKDGKIVKIQGSNGSILGTYATQETILKPLLLIPGFVFAVTEQGNAHKINSQTMVREWVYQAGSPIATTASYSPKNSAIIFGTDDLNVHAVSQTGQLLWKTKPTVRSATEYCGYYNYDFRWPVVAEIPGVVFIRMRNPNTFESPGSTNTAIRQYLTNKPEEQTLFALDVNTGVKKFLPNVSPDGSDNRPACNGTTGQLFHMISAAPIIKTIAGKQFAYIPWRNSQAPYDSRWDGFMGEMVLDNTSISGYQAGDLRFVNFLAQLSTNMIADEIHTVSMAGNTIFHHHANNIDSHRITDRSDAKGSSMSNMITTIRNPEIVRHWILTNDVNPTNPNLATHYNTGLAYDARNYGDGFWIYQGKLAKEMIYPEQLTDPSATIAEDGAMNRYVFVSGGKIIVTGPRGDIFVLNHSGSVASPPPTPSSSCTSDINQDQVVDITDYSILVRNFFKSPLIDLRADITRDGIVDLSDYHVLVGNFLKPLSSCL